MAVEKRVTSPLLVSTAEDWRQLEGNVCTARNQQGFGCSRKELSESYDHILQCDAMTTLTVSLQVCVA